MIKGRVIKVFTKAVKKYALENESKRLDTQVLLSITNEGVISYEVCNKFQPIKQVSFLDLLDVKIDLLSREAIATPFLQNSFINLQNELKVAELRSMKVIIFPKNEDSTKFGLHVFADGKAVKEISFDEIFNQSEILN